MVDLSDSSQISQQGSRGGEFRYTVANLSQLEGTVLSDKHRVDGFLWRVVVVLKDVTPSSQGGKSKSLGVYLQKLDESTNMLGDTAVTQATITLVNQDNPDKSYSKEFKHTYSSNSTDWGYTPFIKWRDLTNPARGFVKNNAITLTAEIKVLQDHKRLQATRSSILSCPVCCTEYEPDGSKQPMSLRCGHTFCSDCLESQCNPTPDSTMAVVCTVCKQEHSGGSSRELWFPNHSVTQMIGRVIPKSQYYCDTHRQNMDYYCLTDSCLVCIGCAYQGEHAGHSCKLVSEAKAEIESLLGQAAKKVVSKSAEVSRKLQLLKDEQRALKLQEEGLIQVVDESYKQLEEMVRKQKQLQLQELRAHTEELACSVDAQIRGMEDKSSQVKNALKEFKAWQSLPARDALHNVSELKSNLEASGSLSTDTTAAQLSTSVSFVKPFSELFSAIEKQGRLELAGPNSSQVSINGAQTESVAKRDDNGDDGKPPSKRKKLVS